MAELKNGFTTGTTATAAAMAALLFARCNIAASRIDVPLPPFDGASIAVPIERAGLADGCLAFAEARKYGGDDPDATSGMLLRAEIFAGTAPGIEIDGGQGIGKVTLPGLPVPPGQAAINPVPLRQIRHGLRQTEACLPPLRVVISAPEGAARAARTMNARLGIVGGISILGTQGIVRPYSNAAYLASITEAINVARATGCRHICLGTGRRTIAQLATLHPELPQQAFIVAGDFVEDSLRQTRDFADASWGCFFGKLVKLAQGLGNTHANTADLDLDFVARTAGIPALADCNTASEALERILKNRRIAALADLAQMAKRHAMKFSGRHITIHLFHTDGRELTRA